MEWRLLKVQMEQAPFGGPAAVSVSERLAGLTERQTTQRQARLQNTAIRVDWQREGGGLISPRLFPFGDGLAALGGWSWNLGKWREKASDKKDRKASGHPENLG